jgi:hypothetical protein
LLPRRAHIRNRNRHVAWLAAIRPAREGCFFIRGRRCGNRPVPRAVDRIGMGEDYRRPLCFSAGSRWVIEAHHDAVQIDTWRIVALHHDRVMAGNDVVS